MLVSYSNQLFKRYSDNPILTTKDWPYPVNSVFNCGAILFAGQTLLLVRVEDRTGLSHLTIAKSQDGFTNWKIDSKPSLYPEQEDYPEEIWGLEDPRITYIDELNEYYITYTAYSKSGPLVSLAKTKDFMTFDKLGAILPPENKDSAIFPIRIKDQWVLIHRASNKHIWIAYSPDLIHWGKHNIILKARQGGWWDAGKIGLSPPPIRVPEGWLVLYHGVRRSVAGVIYRLGLALFDLENPEKLLRRSEEWIFSPTEDYERVGDVGNVVFPCGWLVENDEVRLYYGGADTSIALATTNLSDLRNYILTCPSN